jgi:hypothetical protein
MKWYRLPLTVHVTMFTVITFCAAIICLIEASASASETLTEGLASDDHPYQQSGLSRTVDLAPCSAWTNVSSSCVTSPLSVHPTQLALGFKDVTRKQAKIRDIKHSPPDLETYLRHNILRAVKGPAGVFYIIDGHHRCRALVEEGVETIYLRVTKDLSQNTLDEFWSQMSKDQLVWLYDEHGRGPLDPTALPRSIWALQNDPYRDLAEDALNRGGYAKTDTPFQEFMWANFYRLRIEMSVVRDDYNEALKRAISISHTNEAAHLPGYLSKLSMVKDERSAMASWRSRNAFFEITSLK